MSLISAMAFTDQMTSLCNDIYEKDMKERALMNPIYDEDEEFYQSTRQENLSNDYYDDFSRTARMYTIYESYEEFVDSSDERSNEASSNIYSSDDTSSARGSADSRTDVLRRSVRAWCDATGLPTTVLVEAKDRSFRLHKFPLVSRSGYFKCILLETTSVKLPDDFPGGSDIFEVVAKFCYDSTIHIEASNVAALRCSAEFLEMTEEYGKGNLCQKTDSYLTRIAFHSWVDTMLVLKQSEKLLPLSEESLIISRCIESLACAACMKLQIPVATPGSVGRNPLLNEDKSAEGASATECLLTDLVKLPLALFGRLVVALRRQGMEEKYVSQIIIEYLRKWIFDPDAESDLALNDDEEDDEVSKRASLLEVIVRMLPLERFIIPLNILFSLHGCALAWEASTECRVQLETRIASQLELATIEDFLMSMRASKDSSISRTHIDSMQQIVSLFMSQQQILLDSSEMLDERDLKNVPSYTFLAVSAVAKVWDEYLTEIACGPGLSPRKFSDLSNVVPSHIRITHDQLYKAVHIYLKSHNTLSHSDRLLVCNALNCQKLSQELCIHAVQNELMPLRLIVQAMFIQQLQSRFPNSDADGESLGSSGRVGPCHKRTTSDGHGNLLSNRQDDGIPLGLILQRDAAFREAAFLKDDFEATKARLRELEQELVRMKRNMQDTDRTGSDGSNYGKQTSENEFSTRSSAFMDGKSRKKFGGNCICQIWGAQANGIRLGQRITKTFQKLGLGGFWKSRAVQREDRNSAAYVGEPSSGSCHGTDGPSHYIDSAAPRANSLRRAEVDYSSLNRRHSRHHSIS